MTIMKKIHQFINWLDEVTEPDIKRARLDLENLLGEKNKKGLMLVPIKFTTKRMLEKVDRNPGSAFDIGNPQKEEYEQCPDRYFVSIVEGANSKLYALIATPIMRSIDFLREIGMDLNYKGAQPVCSLTDINNRLGWFALEGRQY